MGVYCLDREKGLVNGKRVWKLQGSFRGIDAWYLFYAGDEAARWCVCSTDMFEESFGFVRTAVNTHRHYSPLNQKWEVWATSGEMVADATLRVVPMPIEANHVARVCGAYRKVRCSRPRTHTSRQPRAPRRRSSLSFARAPFSHVVPSPSVRPVHVTVTPTYRKGFFDIEVLDTGVELMNVPEEMLVPAFPGRMPLEAAFEVGASDEVRCSCFSLLVLLFAHQILCAFVCALPFSFASSFLALQRAARRGAGRAVQRRPHRAAPRGALPTQRRALPPLPRARYHPDGRCADGEGARRPRTKRRRAAGFLRRRRPRRRGAGRRQRGRRCRRGGGGSGGRRSVARVRGVGARQRSRRSGARAQVSFLLPLHFTRILLTV